MRSDRAPGLRAPGARTRCAGLPASGIDRHLADVGILRELLDSTTGE